MSEVITVVLEDGADRYAIVAAIEQLKGVRNTGPSEYQQAKAVVIEAVRGAIKELDQRLAPKGTP